MNKEYQHSEMIEAYLRDELSEDQAADFEQLLERDPLVKEEFLLQKEIVASLQSYRKAQLKARLNQVDVSSVPSAGSVGTVAAWLGGLVLVGTLAWFGNAYLNKETPAAPQPLAAGTQTVVAPEPVQPQPAPEANQEKTSETGAAATMPVPAAKPTNRVAKVKKQSTATSAEVPATLPDGDINASLQETQPRKADVEAAEKPTFYGNTANAANRLNVVDNTNESLKLHYYARNGQIALLGFDKPYTFLDMPDENVTYLHYDGNFYKLNLNQKQPAPIQNVLVTDAALIETLQKMLTERK